MFSPQTYVEKMSRSQTPIPIAPVTPSLSLSLAFHPQVRPDRAQWERQVDAAAPPGSTACIGIPPIDVSVLCSSGGHANPGAGGAYPDPASVNGGRRATHAPGGAGKGTTRFQLSAQLLRLQTAAPTFGTETFSNIIKVRSCFVVPTN
jgi:hypothetical protein